MELTSVIIALVTGIFIGFAAAYFFGFLHTKTANDLAREIFRESESLRKEDRDAVIDNVKASFGNLSARYWFKMALLIPLPINFNSKWLFSGSCVGWVKTFSKSCMPLTSVNDSRYSWLIPALLSSDWTNSRKFDIVTLTPDNLKVLDFMVI